MLFLRREASFATQVPLATVAYLHDPEHHFVLYNSQNNVLALLMGLPVLSIGTPNHTAQSYRKWNVDYLEFLIGLVSLSCNMCVYLATCASTLQPHACLPCNMCK